MALKFQVHKDHEELVRKEESSAPLMVSPKKFIFSMHLHEILM